MSSFVLVNQRVANYLKNKYINNLTLRKTFFGLTMVTNLFIKLAKRLSHWTYQNFSYVNKLSNHKIFAFLVNHILGHHYGLGMPPLTIKLGWIHQRNIVLHTFRTTEQEHGIIKTLRIFVKSLINCNKF